jgi:hypothetical protein
MLVIVLSIILSPVLIHFVIYMLARVLMCWRNILVLRWRIGLLTDAALAGCLIPTWQKLNQFLLRMVPLTSSPSS